jgi:protein SHQ1
VACNSTPHFTPAGIRTHIKTAHYAAEFPLPGSGANDDTDEGLSTVSLSRARRTNNKAVRTLEDADVDDDHEQPKRGKKRTADDADYAADDDDDNNDDDNNNNDDDDLVDGDEHVNAADETAAGAASASAGAAKLQWNSLAKKVSDGWLCCNVVY